MGQWVEEGHVVVGVHVDPGEVPYLVVVHGEVGHHGQVEAHQVHQDVKVFEGGLEEEDLWVQGLWHTTTISKNYFSATQNYMPFW